jgi:uncharacterized protein YqeY
VFERKVTPLGLGHNIGHSVGWVERSETQQLIGVGFRSSTQPTKNSDGLKYEQGPLFELNLRSVYFSRIVLNIGDNNNIKPFYTRRVQAMAENTAQYGWDGSMGISLYDKIRQDMKAAMRKKDTAVRDTMRLIMGAFPEITVPITLESGKKSTRAKTPEEITDEDIHNIIRKFVKSEKTVLEIKKEPSSDYLELLESYLPKMATTEQIEAWIKSNVDFSAIKSPMQAMGAVMKHFGKLADGNQVKDVLQGMTIENYAFMERSTLNYYSQNALNVAEKY